MRHRQSYNIQLFAKITDILTRKKLMSAVLSLLYIPTASYNLI